MAWRAASNSPCTKDMRLLHYSQTPLIAVRSTAQLPSAQHKPRGLWVSIEGENDWRSWCEGESFNLSGLDHTAEIRLRGDARILHIAGASALDAFTAEYGDSHEKQWRRAILWRNVAERYHGIIIAPYIWSRRLAEGCGWYYGWDCASGCIWDAASVEHVEALQCA